MYQTIADIVSMIVWSFISVTGLEQLSVKGVIYIN